MATYYFTGNTNNNWGTATNWSTTSGGTGDGAVPTSADDAIFDSLSPNCTVNVSGSCKTITFSTYTNTITMTNGITIAGSITLGAGMGISGSGGLTVTATGTLTSNGKTWPNDFSISSNSQTYTLADNWTINGTATLREVINGNTLNINGNLTSNSPSSGTTLINIIGNCTWTGNSTNRIGNSITVNCGANTLTISGAVSIGGGTYTYTSGTVVTTGSTVYAITSGSTFAWSGITFDTFNFNATGVTNTLTQNINTINLTTTSITTCNGSAINITGNLSMNRTLSGTTTLNINGTGSQTWSVTDTTQGILQLNTNINKSSGTLTVSGTVLYNTGTLTYTSGTVTTTGSTLTIITTTTLNTGTSTLSMPNGIIWNNVSTGSTPLSSFTLTLLSDLRVTNLSVTMINSAILSLNGFTTYISGDLTLGNTQGILSGTSNIVLNGTGTWSTSLAHRLRNNLTINTSGTITIGTNVYHDTGTLTYVAGTVVTTGSTLTVNNTSFINTGTSTVEMPNGIIWNNITFNAGSVTCTLSSDLRCSGTFTITSATTFNNNNIYVGSLSHNANTFGTSAFILNGTGSWSSLSNIVSFNPNLTINTTGTITLGTNVVKNSGTITYTQGTIVTTGSTFNIGGGVTMSGNWSGITFSNFAISQSSGNLTLSSDINTQNLTHAISTTVTTVGAYNIYVNGNLSFTSTGGLLGTATIILKGTGSWTQTSTGYLQSNLTINTSGTITLSGSITFGGSKLLTYQNGTVVTTGSTVTIANSTLNTSGMTWSNVTFNGGTNTLNSNLNINNTMSVVGGSTINSNNIYVYGDLTLTSGTLAGTSNLFMQGNGTWSGAGVLGMRTSINTTGTFSVSGIVTLGTATFSYISGNTVTTGSTLSFSGASFGLDCNGSSSSLATTTSSTGINWNNVLSNTTTSTITNISPLCVVGAFTKGNSFTMVWNGARTYIKGGFTIGNSISGTSIIRLFGGTLTGGSLSNQLEFDAGASLITVSGTFNHSGSTMSWISGSVSTIGSQVNVTTDNLDVSPITWNNFGMVGQNNLFSDLNIGGTVSFGSAGNISGNVNGTYSTNVYGGYVIANDSGGAGGSGTVYLLGSGTITTTGARSPITSHNMTINASGTYSILTNTTWGMSNTKTLRYISGGFVTTGTTFSAASMTFDVNGSTASGATTSRNGGINFDNITFGAATITATTPIYSYGNVSIVNTTINGSPVYVNGSLNNTTTTGTGTSEFIMVGSGTLSSASNTLPMQHNVKIQTNGQISLGTNFTFGTATFSYLYGTVSTSGSTLNIVLTCAFDTKGSPLTSDTTTSSSGINWNNVSLETSNSATITNNSNMRIIGTLSRSNATVTSTFNGSPIYISGGLSFSSMTTGNIAGSSNIVMIGTGSISMTSITSGSLKNNLIFNTPGTITIGGTFSYNTGTITYTAGTINTSGSTLVTNLATTFNTNGMQWNHINFSGANTKTINSTLYTNGILTMQTNNQTFAGTSGFNASSLYTITNGLTHTFGSGLTYSIRDNLTIAGSLLSPIVFKSSTAGIQTNIVLNVGATILETSFASATDINSSGGRTIWTRKGVLTNATNWDLTVQPRTLSKTN